MKLRDFLEYLDGCDEDKDILIHELSDLYDVELIAVQEKIKKIVLSVKITSREDKPDKEWLH